MNQMKITDSQMTLVSKKKRRLLIKNGLVWNEAKREYRNPETGQWISEMLAQALDYNNLKETIKKKLEI